MGWLSGFAKQKVEMVRLWSNALTLGYVKTWEHEVKQLLKEANVSDSSFLNTAINIKATMNNFRNAIVEFGRITFGIIHRQW